MASTHNVFIGFVFVLIISLAKQMVQGRDIPTDAKFVDKKLHPEWLGHFDGSVLVPGIGRFMVPKKGSHVNPFTYNPITGTNGGNGVSIPGIGGSTGGGNYIPGGDDTTLPNPGMEVPNPAGGGTVPVPSRH
ncbi:hypothetical protein BUALT_Bualt18G0023000 [Buddleja alternifolia]|uniref:Cell wall protein n=1 Tax=Buddleja alternifolia TaxID=168488 RepID=A0AAV6WC96_9LAMI|nr:hypothetical protein BUALT_Bualt18G0023000 [Buddleja alternifolia]